MLLISDPKTGLSDDEDSDLVFDNFTLSAICKSECCTGYAGTHTLQRVHKMHLFTSCTCKTEVHYCKIDTCVVTERMTIISTQFLAAAQVHGPA